MADKTVTAPQEQARIDNDVKVIEAREYEGVDLDMEKIMASEDKPNPFGSGYIKLYLLVALLFLNSTMNGEWFASIVVWC